MPTTTLNPIRVRTGIKVLEAEKRLLARGEKKEYAPIEGLPGFIKRALEFAYGVDCQALKDGRIAAVQSEHL